MTNALTEQLMRALPEGDDPLQRLKQLAQEMGIERPTRRTKRAFLRVAQRLGIECPAETRGSRAPMRSEERRVGKECRSRWSAAHSKKKIRSSEGVFTR